MPPPPWLPVPIAPKGSAQGDPSAVPTVQLGEPLADRSGRCALGAPIGRIAASLTNHRSGPTDLIDTERTDLSHPDLSDQVLIEPVLIEQVLEGLLATVLAQIEAVPVKHVLREHL
ncbi:MAG: hypothetical protein EBX47_08765 [Synechococcaceae bacterium WB8_1B_057]|nr:hypothetical protein [Synechococcaceae bacterium WB8_1B_057]